MSQQEVQTPDVVTPKVVAPRARPETVARGRVGTLLDEARGQPLTLVCAPAGYGKTTALVHWLGTLGEANAWVSLGEEDNDPRRLSAHLLAALDRLWPAAVWPAQQALLAGSDVVETIVPLVAEAIEREIGDSGLVLVLDDYHLVTDGNCHRIVTALVDALPDGARIVIASRVRPRIRFARRRAARTVAEIGPAELAFRAEETERLLNGSLRLRLDPTHVEAIRGSVEGWPAGLSLVAATLRDEPDPEDVIAALHGSNDHIAEYLMEEVLDALSPQMRTFLSRTSILGRMNASLCEALLEDPEAEALLADARRSNLFLVSDGDGEEPWFRYHGLFAGLLEQDLRRREPDAVAALHRRAALWFREARMLEEAIDHAIAAGDGKLAARILHDDAWWPLLIERRYATLHRMIARMPPDRGDLAPFCDVLDALCRSLEGEDMRLVAERLAALQAHRDAPGVATLLDGTLSSPFFGDIPCALASGWRLWHDYPQTRPRVAGNLASALWFAGEPAAIRDVIAPYMGRTDRPSLRSREHATLALCAADAGDPTAAERDGREAVALVESSGGETALEAHYAYVALAEALRRRGNLDEAYEQIAKALHITEKLPRSLFHGFALVIRAQIDLSSRNRRAASRHAATARGILDQYPDTGVLERRLAEVEATLAHATVRAPADSEPTMAERRVLGLLASDLTRAQIARRLGLSPQTVKSHTRRLYRRLGAHTRDEAVEIARERGLL